MVALNDMSQVALRVPEGSLYAQFFVPQAFAEESGIPFLEMSAKNAINVEQAFHDHGC